MAHTHTVHTIGAFWTYIHTHQKDKLDIAESFQNMVGISVSARRHVHSVYTAAHGYTYIRLYLDADFQAMYMAAL